MRLSFDICRCHDEKCQLRDNCKRWLTRAPPLSGPWTPHTETFRQDKRRSCDEQIKLDDNG